MAEENKRDWNHFIPSWDFNEIAIGGYEKWGWKFWGDSPFVMMEHKHGQSDSRKIAIEFDDIARGQCYYRDWTSSGTPGVSDGETYWSGFWFEEWSDARKFKDMYGGVGIWDVNFKEFVADCNKRR